jgi:hypothetical protein
MTLLGLCCEIPTCGRLKNRSPRSRLCREHLIVEVLRLCQAKGYFSFEADDVTMAMKGYPGEIPSAIRKVLDVMVKHEDRIITKYLEDDSDKLIRGRE